MSERAKPAEKTQSQGINGNAHKTKGATHLNGQTKDKSTNQLTALGEKIFLDRYALKDGKKESVAVGDVVIVAVNKETGQREIATVTALQGRTVTVELRDGQTIERPLEQLDKPLETRPEQMLDRVAQGIAAVEAPNKQTEWQQKFRWLLDDWKFVPGGRILTAAGTDQNLTFYNCYVIPSPQDSRGGIMTTLTQMTEIMSRGGGVGINISSLRPHHAYVKGVNGRSSGAVSWGELYSFVTGLIEQGGSRRGALMLIMNVWHPDVLEFINSKRMMGRITNANISIGITDDFMGAVKADGDWNLVFPDTGVPDYDELWDGNLTAWQAAGKPVVVHKTVKARDIWNSIIESAWASAEPGVFFVERYNKLSNSHYFAPILCTNPCTTGDTLVSTEHGYVRARDLRVGMQIRTPAGLKPIEKIYNNGVQRIYRVEFSDGGYLECTADHKLKVVRDKKYEWVAVSNLRQGDKVLVSANEAFGLRRNLPAEAMAYIKKRDLRLADYYDRSLGFVVGVVMGDGTLRKLTSRNSYSYQCRIAFGAHEEEWFNQFVSLMDRMNIHTLRTTEEKDILTSDGTVVTHAAVRLHCYKLATLLVKIGLRPNLKAPDKIIPETFLQMEKEFLAGILDGLFSTDGSVLLKQDNPMLRFHTASYELAQQVRLLLLQFGIHGRIYTATRAEDLEYDGRSMVGTGVKYDLVVMNEGIARFYAEIGLSHPEKGQRLKEIAENWHFIGGTWTASVISVQDTEREEEVYDLYEPNTLTWITNGYVSFDCGEQGLPAWGVCNLGALNLARFVTDGQVDWPTLGQAVRYAVRFLDNVIDATPYFFEENKQQQLSERRVGLGTMGLAEMMIRLKIRYGSPASVEFLDQLYRFIASEAYLASAEYAAEKGAFPMFETEKFLQSGFMQGMPEEVRAAIRRQGIRNVTLLTQAPTGTTGTMVNTSTGIEPFYFWSFHRKGRMGTHEERVAVYDEWLTQHPGQPMPDYFVTAMDLQPEDHVKVQAAIQRWVDSSLSKTCNTPNDYTVEQTRQLYELMYDLGCKGGTVYRDGSRDVQVLNLKEEDKSKTAEKKTPPAPEIKWRVRPSTLHGKTYRKNTPIGTAYITVNANGGGDQQPFEVFINVGKAGSDVAADAEGLGRLISLILRMPSPLTPEERVRDIVSQLRGIGSGRQQGFGKNRVMSLPDAIGQSLADHAGFSATGDLPGLPEDEATQLPLSLKGDYCPSCGSATLVHVEGCKKCYECGYSEC
jgi:ribonucleoside-diphosphate reductase alpha chain